MDGFPITREDWERLDTTQQMWLVYNALVHMCERVNRLEKRGLFDKMAAFLGGVVGGIAAVFGMKTIK